MWAHWILKIKPNWTAEWSECMWKCIMMMKISRVNKTLRDGMWACVSLIRDNTPLPNVLLLCFSHFTSRQSCMFFFTLFILLSGVSRLHSCTVPCPFPFIPYSCLYRTQIFPNFHTYYWHRCCKCALCKPNYW